jgi:hypothetical protein
MGALHGNMRGYQAYIGNEGIVCPQEGNHRKNLWNSKREPWITIYADVWQSPNGNESRVNLCVHEFKEAGKNQERMGT